MAIGSFLNVCICGSFDSLSQIDCGVLSTSCGPSYLFRIKEALPDSPSFLHCLTRAALFIMTSGLNKSTIFEITRRGAGD